MEQIPARNTHIKYVMKFPAVYKTLRFIAVFTKDIMQIYSRNTCTELATANCYFPLYKMGEKSPCPLQNHTEVTTYITVLKHINHTSME